MGPGQVRPWDLSWSRTCREVGWRAEAQMGGSSEKRSRGRQQVGTDRGDLFWSEWARQALGGLGLTLITCLQCPGGTFTPPKSLYDPAGTYTVPPFAAPAASSAFWNAGVESDFGSSLNVPRSAPKSATFHIRRDAGLLRGVWSNAYDMAAGTDLSASSRKRRGSSFCHPRQNRSPRRSAD